MNARSAEADAKIIVAGGAPLADLMRREYNEALYLGINMAMSVIGNCHRDLTDKKTKCGAHLCAKAVQKLLLEKEPGKATQIKGPGDAS